MRRDVAIAAVAIHGTMTMSGSLGVAIKTHFRVHWAQIAIDQEAAGVSARARAVEVGSGAGAPYAETLAAEFSASMIAVAGSADAIDAWYGAVQRSVPVPASLHGAWTASRTARWAELLHRGAITSRDYQTGGFLAPKHRHYEYVTIGVMSPVPA